mgnify:CR=1 FL=1
MNPEFRSLLLTCAMVLLISGIISTSLSVSWTNAYRSDELQGMNVTSAPAADEAHRSECARNTAIEDWERTRQELTLLYFTYPYLNPLELEVLQRYSADAAQYLNRLSGKLNHAAMLLGSSLNVGLSESIENRLVDRSHRLIPEVRPEVMTRREQIHPIFNEYTGQYTRRPQ